MNSTNDHHSSTNTINETEDDFVAVNSQQTAVSTLTQDSSLSKWTTTTKSTKKRPVSSSVLPASSVKTRRIGLSTSVEPISKDQYIPNDDKTKKFAQFVKKPHEDASKKFNLKAPPPSYTGDNWKYFHVVGYYKDSPKEQHNHSTDNEHACCNMWRHSDVQKESKNRCCYEIDWSWNEGTPRISA
jgi:hypothetical protein